MPSPHQFKPQGCHYCCSSRFFKRGYFYKRVTKTYIPRYKCVECKRSFSTSTAAFTFRQKRPDLNLKVFKLLCSGVSLRQSARVLGCSYLTVYRKFLRLSEQARVVHGTRRFSANEVQFDEMESIEHTKLKPLTIALAVNEEFQILGAKVGRIPAKGHLHRISVWKYGLRRDESKETVSVLLKTLSSQLETDFVLKSDAKPKYFDIASRIFHTQKHETFLSRGNKEKRRELKYTSLEKRIFDPLFALNQRSAKLRDHVKRLCRRSWCTTKKPENLEHHIYLYIAANNGYCLG